MAYSIFIQSIWPFLLGVVTVFVYSIIGRLDLDENDEITALALKSRGKSNA